MNESKIATIDDGNSSSPLPFSLFLKLIDASLLIGAITGVNYVCQWIYLKFYLSEFGLQMEDFSFTIQDILFVSVYPILISLSLIVAWLALFEIRADNRFLREMRKFDFMLLVLGFVLITASCALIGDLVGDHYAKTPLTKGVTFLIDGTEVNGYYLLYKNDGNYYFYKPQDGDFPDIKIVKQDSIKQLDLNH